MVELFTCSNECVQIEKVHMLPKLSEKHTNLATIILLLPSKLQREIFFPPLFTAQ